MLSLFRDQCTQIILHCYRDMHMSRCTRMLAICVLWPPENCVRVNRSSLGNDIAHLRLIRHPLHKQCSAVVARSILDRFIDRCVEVHFHRRPFRQVPRLCTRERLSQRPNHIRLLRQQMHCALMLPPHAGQALELWQLLQREIDLHRSFGLPPTSTLLRCVLCCELTQGLL